MTRSWESLTPNDVNKLEARLAQLEYQRSAAVTASGRGRILKVELAQLAHLLLIEHDRNPALAQGDAIVKQQLLSGHPASQKSTVHHQVQSSQPQESFFEACFVPRPF